MYCKPLFIYVSPFKYAVVLYLCKADGIYTLQKTDI